MVKIMENPIKMYDLGGFTTPIFGSTPILNYVKNLGRVLSYKPPKTSNHQAS